MPNYLNPTAKILIEGKSLPLELAVDLLSVSISEEITALSMFTLTFTSWDTIAQKITSIDAESLDIGKQVEIQLGYDNKLTKVMVGEITGLEPEFSQDSVPTVVVRGYDLRHRLMRGRSTQSFLKMKDSDIASQIARKQGLTAQVTDSKVKLDYILQHNQTDWEFLQSRAERIGYEVVVEDKTLYFRPHPTNTSKILTLTYPDDLLEFSPRLSTMTQIPQIQIQGWDFRQKQAVLSTAKVGQEGSQMGGKTTGTKIVEKSYGKGSDTQVTQTIANKAEADQMAIGQFQDMAIAYITGDGTCKGNPQVRAGKVIEIKGVGKRFSGLYYLSSTEHRYSVEQGYQTSFTIRRTAT